MTPRTLPLAKPKVNSEFCRQIMAPALGPGQHGPMVKRTRKSLPKTPPRPKWRRLYIYEWIEALGLNQRQVAERAGIGESHLSLLASGNRAYVQGTLERIASAMGLERGQLFYPPPGRSLWAAIADLTDEQQQTVLRLIDALKGPPN